MSWAGGRLAMLVALTCGPAAAWEFSSLPICTLTHPTEKGEVTVTYDPITLNYAISLRVTLGDPWPVSQSFEMVFLGPRPIRIGTNQHALSDDRRTLTVSDSGFANVLDGLQYNAVATGQSGKMQMVMSLSGAAEPVAAFRACGDLPLS